MSLKKSHFGLWGASDVPEESEIPGTLNDVVTTWSCG
jgi:hypothetical protein